MFVEDPDAELWWYQTELMRAPSGRIPCFMPLPRGLWLDDDDWRWATEVKRQRTRNFDLLKSVRVLDLELAGNEASSLWRRVIAPALPRPITLRLIPDQHWNFHEHCLDVHELIVFCHRLPVHPPLKPRGNDHGHFSTGEPQRIVYHLPCGSDMLSRCDRNGGFHHHLLTGVETVVVFHSAWALGQIMPRAATVRKRPRKQWIGSGPYQRSNEAMVKATNWRRSVIKVFLGWIRHSNNVNNITFVNMNAISAVQIGAPDYWNTESVRACILDPLEGPCYRDTYLHRSDPDDDVGSFRRLKILDGKQYMAQLSPTEVQVQGRLELEPGQVQHLLPGHWKQPRAKPRRKLAVSAPKSKNTQPAIDLPAYVHIAERIIDAADSQSLAVLRQTCRAIRERVDPQLFKHLILQNIGDRPGRPAGFIFSSPCGPLPGFPARGWSWDREDFHGGPQIPDWEVDQRRHYHRLLSMVQILDYAAGYHKVLGSLVLSMRNVRVLRVVHGYPYGIECNPFPARTMVAYTTPRCLKLEPGGETVTDFTRKLVYHAIYHAIFATEQRNYGIPYLPRCLGELRGTENIVIVFSPFVEIMHPDYWEGPTAMADDSDYSDDMPGRYTPQERRSKFLEQVAGALYDRPRMLRIVNFHLVPPLWLGFPAEWSVEDVKSAMIDQVRDAIWSYGEDLDWRTSRDWDEDTVIDDPDEFVQCAMDRIIWMTGDEYYASIPEEDVVAESTIELVPGERHWLLPNVKVGPTRSRPVIDNDRPYPSENAVLEQLVDFNRWCSETDYGDDDEEYNLDEIFYCPPPVKYHPPIDWELLEMLDRLHEEDVPINWDLLEMLDRWQDEDQKDDGEGFSLDYFFNDVAQSLVAAQSEMLGLLERWCPDEESFYLDTLFILPPTVVPWTPVMEYLGILRQNDDDGDRDYGLGAIFDPPTGERYQRPPRAACVEVDMEFNTWFHLDEGDDADEQVQVCEGATS